MLAYGNYFAEKCWHMETTLQKLLDKAQNFFRQFTVVLQFFLEEDFVYEVRTDHTALRHGSRRGAGCWF